MFNAWERFSAVQLSLLKTDNSDNIGKKLALNFMYFFQLLRFANFVKYESYRKLVFNKENFIDRSLNKGFSTKAKQHFAELF